MAAEVGEQFLLEEYAHLKAAFKAEGASNAFGPR